MGGSLAEIYSALDQEAMADVFVTESWIGGVASSGNSYSWMESASLARV